MSNDQGIILTSAAAAVSRLLKTTGALPGPPGLIMRLEELKEWRHAGEDTFNGTVPLKTQTLSSGKPP